MASYEVIPKTGFHNVEWRRTSSFRTIARNRATTEFGFAASSGVEVFSKDFLEQSGHSRVADERTVGGFAKRWCFKTEFSDGFDMPIVDMPGSRSFFGVVFNIVSNISSMRLVRRFGKSVPGFGAVRELVNRAGFS